MFNRPWQITPLTLILALILGVLIFALIVPAFSLFTTYETYEILASGSYVLLVCSVVMLALVQLIRYQIFLYSKVSTRTKIKSFLKFLVIFSAIATALWLLLNALLDNRSNDYYGYYDSTLGTVILRTLKSLVLVLHAGTLILFSLTFVAVRIIKCIIFFCRADNATRKKVLSKLALAAVIITTIIFLSDFFIFASNTMFTRSGEKRAAESFDGFKGHNRWWLAEEIGNNLSIKTSLAREEDLKEITSCQYSLGTAPPEEKTCIKSRIVVGADRFISTHQIQNDLKKMGLNLDQTYPNREAATLSPGLSTKEMIETPTITDITKFDPPAMRGLLPASQTFTQWRTQIISQYPAVRKIGLSISDQYEKKVSPFRKMKFYQVYLEIDPSASDEQIKQFLEEVFTQGGKLETARGPSGLDPAYFVKVPENQEFFWVKEIKSQISYMKKADVISCIRRESLFDKMMPSVPIL